MEIIVVKGFFWFSFLDKVIFKCISEISIFFNVI